MTNALPPGAIPNSWPTNGPFPASDIPTQSSSGSATSTSGGSTTTSKSTRPPASSSTPGTSSESVPTTGVPSEPTQPSQATGATQPSVPSESGGTSGSTAPSTTVAPLTIGKQPTVSLNALQAARASQDAALWAYGLVAAYDAADIATINQMITSHQSDRDTLANLIVQGGGTPGGPSPVYSTPKPVTDAASARALALTIEIDCAQAWYAIIGIVGDSGLRNLAVTSLSNTALRMMTWKQLAKDAVVTTALPGQPG